MSLRIAAYTGKWNFNDLTSYFETFAKSKQNI